MRVARPVADAFRIFTQRMDAWWPFESHSIFQSRVKGVEFDPRIGGEVHEMSVDGERATWGRVLAWDPPNGFAMTWHPGRDPDQATELEVRFTADAGGTRVELVHRGWERLRAQAEEIRASYEQGWNEVLGAYQELCAADPN